jgi:hypothetical protein
MVTTAFHIDGKVGAEEGAQLAVDAMGVRYEFGGMVALRVCLLGHGEDCLGTEFDTESASFASFFNDVDDAVRNPDAFPIQGLSPIGHVRSSILH